MWRAQDAFFQPGAFFDDKQRLRCAPRSRDFGAGDNLTLVYRGRRKANGLTETEIKFEAIEPGQSRLDTFLSEFVGQIFVLLA